MESGGEDIHFSENAYEKANQGSEQFDEPNKINSLDEGPNVPKKVHQFYFVKFRPHEDPRSASEIEKAENLIRKLNHDQIRITKRLQERESYQRWTVHSDIRRLQYSDSGLGETLNSKRYTLKRLQVSLDKLSFANKACQARNAESGLLSGNNELANHKLNFQMLHGCKSLAQEKQLVRGTKAIQMGVEDEDQYMCKAASLGELDRTTYSGKYELKVEKCINNAAVKGKIWNSLGSRQAIIEKLKLIEDEVDKLMKEQLEVRAKIGHTKRELHALEEVKDSLRNQLTDIHQRKKEACGSILKLRKQYGKENACYYQNRFLLNQAMKLARKKDVAALEKLSHAEVEKFMSQWNTSETFRKDYEKRVSPSLGYRQLNLDGRLRNLNPEEEPLGLVTPTIVKREAAFTKKELKCLMKDAKPKTRFCWFIEHYY